MATKKIMVVPCIVMSWLKTSGGSDLDSGHKSWNRSTTASAPPMTRNNNAMTTYMMPIFL